MFKEKLSAFRKEIRKDYLNEYFQKRRKELFLDEKQQIM
jgi:hypothetical protein